MSIHQYFKSDIDSRSLENSGKSRLSENAVWLLEQRYFVPRYDPETKSVRKEENFEEFARRVARTIASAEVNYSDNADWLRTLEKNIDAEKGLLATLLRLYQEFEQEAKSAPKESGKKAE